MALPKTLQPALTPDELTFLTENDEISIVPSFSMSRVRLLSVSREELAPCRGFEQCATCPAAAKLSYQRWSS
jgi:hypothetical protein